MLGFINAFTVQVKVLDMLTDPFLMNDYFQTLDSNYVLYETFSVLFRL